MQLCYILCLISKLVHTSPSIFPHHRNIKNTLINKCRLTVLQFYSICCCCCFFALEKLENSRKNGSGFRKYVSFSFSSYAAPCILLSAVRATNAFYLILIYKSYSLWK